MFMKQSSACKIIQFQFGVPIEGLRLEPLELTQIGPLQVGVKLLFAPINPSDLGSIMGTYEHLRVLPAVPGREGVGEIYAVGESIDASLLGRRVRMPLELGSWQDSIVMNAQDLIFVPADVPVEMAAMAFINPPTAWFMLKDFVNLKPGDWIVQNAANSGVGMCVIQMARHLGLRTINVVRNLSLWEEPIKKAGGDVVFQVDTEWFKDTQCKGVAKLALNSVGGRSAIDLIHALEPGGIHVTFGGMTRDPVIWPTRDLIFRDISLRGFEVARYFGTERYKEALNVIFDFFRMGIMDIPVEGTYLLKDFKEAILQAQAYHRKGKILLKSDWVPPTMS